MIIRSAGSVSSFDCAEIIQKDGNIIVRPPLFILRTKSNAVAGNRNEN
jgi:hypothetical protein